MYYIIYAQASVHKLVCVIADRKITQLNAFTKRDITGSLSTKKFLLHKINPVRDPRSKIIKDQRSTRLLTSKRTMAANTMMRRKRPMRKKKLISREMREGEEEVEETETEGLSSTCNVHCHYRNQVPYPRTIYSRHDTTRHHNTQPVHNF